jgi:hypothetical protein
MRMCGDEAEEIDEPPPVESTPAVVDVELEASAEVAQPRYDGTVVIAQDHAVEVVTHPGEVRAYVVDVHGEPPPPARTHLLVNVHTGTYPQPVAMTWNAELGYYAAPLVVVPEPGPMSVVLTVGGRPRFGRVRTYVVAPVPVVHVVAPRPHVDVELAAPPPPSVRAGVHVHAPRPRAHIDVHVAPPPPPSAHIDVRIGVPRPPAVHVVAPRPRTHVHVQSRGKFKHRKHRRRGNARVRIR